MGVASRSWLSGLLMGLGRLGGCSCGKGTAGRVSWVCCSRVWLVVCVGIGDTPAAAWFGWWWVPPRVGGGGMLSGFWGSAPWLPGLCSAALCGWWGVGVGGLVVNCIVDASILL